MPLEAKQVRANFFESRLPSPAYTFAQTAKPLLAPDSLILASGGHCVDADGYQVAFNASYMFYWLGHKGWNVCVEDQSAASIAKYKQKGAAYFVAEKKYLHETVGLENKLRRVYPVTTESDDLVIFDMNGGR